MDAQHTVKSHRQLSFVKKWCGQSTEWWFELACGLSQNLACQFQILIQPHPLHSSSKNKINTIKWMLHNARCISMVLVRVFATFNVYCWSYDKYYLRASREPASVENNPTNKRLKKRRFHISKTIKGSFISRYINFQRQPVYASDWQSPLGPGTVKMCYFKLLLNSIVVKWESTSSNFDAAAIPSSDFVVCTAP